MLTNKYNTLMRRVDGAHMLYKCLHVLVVSRSPHVLDEVRVQLRARRPVFTFISLLRVLPIVLYVISTRPRVAVDKIYAVVDGEVGIAL